MKKVRFVELPSGERIGHGFPCFVVAEIGNNHQGDLSMARELVREAARAGANAVKFQKRHVESLLTRAGREAPYEGPNSFGATYGEHRQALELDIEQMAELKELAEAQGLVFFASTWDLVSLREIVGLDVELLKICSADLVNLPLLRLAGKAGVPIVMSTGMSALPEIDRAVEELRRFHNRIVLLHCNSSYPCPDEQVGLPVLETLRERFGLPVGYSGHERGIGPSVAAAALGACLIERHFTLDRDQRGTDHKASLTPGGLASLVAMIREVEKAMRLRTKKVFPEEQASALKLRKCLVFSRDLPAGHVLCEADLTTRSPAVGLSPMHFDEVLGATLKRPVKHEEPLSWDALSVGVQECSVVASS